MSDCRDPFAPLDESERADASGRRDGGNWTIVMPAPEDAPPLRFDHIKYGAPSRTWIYRDANGGALGYVVRFDRPDGGKDVLPRTLWRDARGRLVWRWATWPALRPLYGLDRLAARPGADVLVVEGEKAADAAQRLFANLVVVTSPNGATSAARADWSALAGRHVAIWPDHDEDGRTYAASVARLVGAAGAASVCVVAVPRGWPAKWDLADELPEGVTRDVLVDMLAAARPVAAEHAPSSTASSSRDATAEGLSQRDMLLEVADRADVWRAPDGEVYATVEMDGHVEHHRVRSRAFRDWLLAETARTFIVKGRPASVATPAVSDALAAIEARARVRGRTHAASLRVVEHESQVYIDMGDAAWRAIAVGSNGWRLVDRTPVPIVRSRNTAALPEPRRGDGFAALRTLLPAMTDDDFMLVIAWMLGALWPRGPYPVLVVGGEQGSGKSTVARVARRLTDPTLGDLLQPPRDDRDLIAAARHNHVLAFDNLSNLRPELADSICRLSTGGQIGGRALYSNDDDASFAAMRPVILNGIPDLATRGDLASRAVIVRLEPLKHRMTEYELRGYLDRVAPEVLGTLLDGLAIAQRRWDEVATPQVRMADFARLVVAAAPAFGWDEADVLAALAENAARAAVTLVDGDVVAQEVRNFVDDLPRGEWRGLVSELYKALGERVPDATHRNADWPRNARWFSDRLRRAAPALRQAGIDVRLRQVTRGTEATLNRGDLAPVVPSAPHAEAGADGANGASGASRPLLNDGIPAGTEVRYDL